MALAIVAPTSTVLGQDTIVEPSSEDMQRAAAFRESFYLRNDPDFVSESFRDADAVKNAHIWSIPVTDEEAADLKQRAEIQDAMTEAIDRASLDLETFAGLWYDNSRGGYPTLFVVEGVDAARRVVDAALPSPAAYDVVQVERSWNDLQALQDTIERERHALKSDGIGLVSTGFDIKNNAVLIGLEEVTESSTQPLIERFGPNLTFRADAAETTFDITYCWNDCLPEKGGIGVYNGDHPANKCTTGFMVRVTTGTDFHGILTAGHCFVVAAGDHGEGDPWRHTIAGADEGVGHAEKDTWFNGADADVGLIDFTGVPSVRNRFVAYNNLDTEDVTIAVGTGSMGVGAMVCSFGYASGRKCGEVDVPNVTRESYHPGIGVTKLIDHQWEVDFDSIGGDSGGPYFNVFGNQAWGLHTHSGTASQQRGWYSPVSWAYTEYLNRHSVAWVYCVTASC